MLSYTKHRATAQLIVEPVVFLRANFLGGNKTCVIESSKGKVRPNTGHEGPEGE
jgi:hypothetical protein